MGSFDPSAVKAAGAGAAAGGGGVAAVAGGIYMMIMQFLSMLLALIQSIIGAIMAFIAAVLGIFAAIFSFLTFDINTCAAASANTDKLTEINQQVGGTVAQTAVAQRVWFLLGQDTGSGTSQGGWPDKSVAALLGNIENESSFNVATVNSIGCKGLFQFCFDRANKMVLYASSNNGGIWQDVDLQVAYMVAERHVGVPELQNPNAYGLLTIDDLSDYWGRYWEVFSTDLNDPEFVERRAASQRWFNSLTIWTSGTGSAKLGNFDAAATISNALEAGIGIDTKIAANNQCKSGVVNAEGNAKAAELAVLLTDGHTRVGDNVNVSSADPTGADKLGEWPNYAKAHDISYPDDPLKLYASCDRFAATVIRLALDKNFAAGGLASDMGVWLSESENWEEITDPAQSMPGDVWVSSHCKDKICNGENGHIMIYVGDHEGNVNVIADASFESRMPALQLTSYAHYAKQPNTFIYRYKGPGEPVESEFVK
jgi:hypothetical protein